jgi:hypothetical protein
MGRDDRYGSRGVMRCTGDSRAGYHVGPHLAGPLNPIFKAVSDHACVKDSLDFPRFLSMNPGSPGSLA